MSEHTEFISLCVRTRIKLNWAMENRRIRIKDIAERAGVSTGTVDRVIHKRGNVSKKARELVLRVMKELDYEPNIIASMLAYNKTITIAALLPDYHTDSYWELPYAGVQKAMEANKHYNIRVRFFLFDLFDTRDFEKKAEEMLAAEPDALLFPPLFQKEGAQLLEACRKAKIPVALINTNLPEQYALTYVGQDSYQSGVLAGKLLNFGLGPGDEVLVLNLDKETTNAQHLLDKEIGLRDYFFENYGASLKVLKIDFQDFDNESALQEMLEKLFRERSGLKGIFVTNSRSYRVMRSLKDQLPAGLRLVGFDLLPENIEYLQQDKISFLINQNPAAQGYLGVMSLLNALIFKKEVDRVQHLPLDIVVTENATYYLKKEEDMQLVSS